MFTVMFSKQESINYLKCGVWSKLEYKVQSIHKYTALGIEYAGLIIEQYGAQGSQYRVYRMMCRVEKSCKHACMFEEPSEGY